jgi:hypothetical protein
LHVDTPAQTFPPHVVPAATGVCVTPLIESHASVVHTLPSSIGSGVPAVHVPEPLHVSAPLQTFPSEHDEPAGAGVWLTPVAGLQLSVVHGFPSSTTGGVPATQVPVALHVSAPLHALPSLHDVP